MHAPGDFLFSPPDKTGRGGPYGRCPIFVARFVHAPLRSVYPDHQSSDRQIFQHCAATLWAIETQSSAGFGPFLHVSQMSLSIGQSDDAMQRFKRVVLPAPFGPIKLLYPFIIVRLIGPIICFCRTFTDRSHAAGNITNAPLVPFAQANEL